MAEEIKILPVGLIDHYFKNKNYDNQ